MIDLYTWKTPNGRKISIMLEEVGLEYEVHPININEGEQHPIEIWLKSLVQKEFAHPSIFVLGL